MVLITGGTGVMGSVLVRRLTEAGNDVRVFTLPDDPNVSRISDYAVDIRYGDISNRADVKTACDGVTTVYHLAAIIIAYDDNAYRRINVEGTRYIVEAAVAAGVKHFIHVSSASVTYPRPTLYALSKRACEELVRSSEMQYTIVRPTLVYDRRGGQEFDMFLDYLAAFPVVPFIGAGNARKRPVYAGDVADGLIAICNNPVTHGKTYNFSGGESITMIEFCRLCLGLMGRGRKPVACFPVWFCRLLAVIMKALMKRPPLRWPVIAGVTQDADLDPAEAIRELGYKPARVRNKLPECFPRS